MALDRLKNAARSPQDGPTTASNWLQIAQDRPKIAQRSPKNGFRSLEMGFRTRNMKQDRVKIVENAQMSQNVRESERKFKFF